MVNPQYEGISVCRGVLIGEIGGTIQKINYANTYINTRTVAEFTNTFLAIVTACPWQFLRHDPSSSPPPPPPNR